MVIMLRNYMTVVGYIKLQSLFVFMFLSMQHEGAVSARQGQVRIYETETEEAANASKANYVFCM